MKEIVYAIICIVLTVISLIISVFSFKEKGFLFNNAYIWASKSEREKMNKKPHYRQTAVVFSLIGAVFLCMAIECFLQTKWLWIIVGVIAIATLIYAVVSDVMIEKRRKEKEIL